MTTWFLAIYLLTQSKNGLSAVQLSGELGVSYNTAWTLKHKLLLVMLEERLAVVSGSCSETTARQIHLAEAHGFDAIRVGAAELADDARGEGAHAIGRRLVGLLRDLVGDERLTRGWWPSATFRATPCRNSASRHSLPAAAAAEPAFDGLQVAFKGGQVG